jgi:hypothetical protein
VAGDTVHLNYAEDGGLALTTEGVTGGDSLDLTPGTLSSELTEKYPHVDGYRAFTIASDDLDLVPGLLKGQARCLDPGCDEHSEGCHVTPDPGRAR